MAGLNELVIDSMCVDEQNCASLAGTFGQISAFKPGRMSTKVANPIAPDSKLSGT